MNIASVYIDIFLVLQKKSKKKSTTEEADERPVFVTLADLDVDTVFPSTSICDNIPSQECFIAADQTIEENQHCERKDADDTDEQIAQGKDFESCTFTTN